MTTESEAWLLRFVWANAWAGQNEKICEVSWPKDRPLPTEGTTVDIEFWMGLAHETKDDLVVRVVEYRPLIRLDTDNHERTEVHARVFVEHRDRRMPTDPSVRRRGVK